MVPDFGGIHLLRPGAYRIWGVATVLTASASGLEMGEHFTAWRMISEPGSDGAGVSDTTPRRGANGRQE